LSALKVNGFKSFADRTLLRFDAGVTAVVGPNGCGKSNIADAIRWVLGEQSAKALRGGKMQDVIFEGTDKRKPLNLCEVAITLTDCEAELGNDFNEIEIARRVHRDGGSNYYLNGRSCRLKDIQRLFMDTGVGRTSYSVMAQGQIDQILSSKPEERRAVFEEAAGISKYKAQRKEALNKLALVEGNLARVTDVIGEIGRQIGSLKRQASKAIRFKKVSHKLRHLDLGYSAFQHQSLSSGLSEVGAAASALQGELDAMVADLEALQAKLLASREQRQDLIQKVQDAQQAVFDLRSAKEHASSLAEMAQVKRLSLSERMEHAREDIGSYESQVLEMRGKLDARESDKQAQLDLLGSFDGVFKERNRELEEIEASLKGAELRIASLRQRVAASERTSGRCRETMAALEVEAAASGRRLEQLCEDLAEQQEAKASAEAALSGYRQKIGQTAERQEELKSELEAGRDAVSACRDAFRSTQARIQEMDRSVAQKSARLKLLQQLQEKLEGYGEGAKALVKGRLGGSLEGRKFPLVASSLEVREGFGVAVEALLGTAIEAVSVEGEDTVVEVFRQLESGKVGRACVCLEGWGPADGAAGDLPDWMHSAADLVTLRDESSQSSLRAVLSLSYVVEDLDAFLKWRAGGEDFKFLQVASLKGETIDARGIVSGGYAGKAKRSGILQREIELKLTRKQLESEQKAIESARAEAEEANRALESAEDQLERFRHELAEAQRDFSTLQTEERNAKRLVEEAEQRRIRICKEKEGLEASRSRSDSQLEAAKAELASCESDLEDGRGELESLEGGIGEIRSERDERREGMSQARFELQEKQQRLDQLSQGMVEMQQRRQELQRLLESKARDIELWQEQESDLEQEIETARQRGESLDGDLERAKGAVEEVRASLVSVEGQITEVEGEQNQRRGRLDALRSRLGEQQVELAQKRSRLDFLQEEVSREYGVELKEVDWQAQLWTARQPVRDLPILDEGGEEEATGLEDAAGSDSSQGDGLEEASEPSEDPPGVLPAPESEGPSDQEREALESTRWEEVKREIATLRKRVQGMGTVNTDAIAEYGELRDRHGFLKGQYDDLVASKQKLEDAIAEINATSREQFSATFDQIRENFRHTFSTLFQGGRADLRLVENEDVLESGIEIVAQPPGTKLKGVSLLSGGQRTMTAVGLLFAIYMVKPSPFCLLDELDAPLDESNIGRFTKLLKQFTEQSQFIIITHNKRTIAAAQAIYGVTMEEKGVSKVVSLKFNSEHGEGEKVSLELRGEGVA